MRIFPISHASGSNARSQCIHKLNSLLRTTLPFGQQISNLYWWRTILIYVFFSPQSCILPPSVSSPATCLLSSSYCLPWITGNIGQKWVSHITITALTLTNSSVPLLLIHFTSFSTCLALSWAIPALTNTNGCSTWNILFLFKTNFYMDSLQSADSHVNSRVLCPLFGMY